MPWKECHVEDERMRFVIRLKDGEKMAALCKEFGISRRLATRWSRVSRTMGWRAAGSEVTPSVSRPVALSANITDLEPAIFKPKAYVAGMSPKWRFANSRPDPLFKYLSNRRAIR